MPHCPAEKSACQPAPCSGARRILIFAVSASLLLAAVTAADLLLRAGDPDAPARAWMRGLHLSAPALWPAGDPLRHPTTVHPGVDLRFCAGLEAAP